MGRKEENIKKALNLMGKVKYIRNMGTVAHIDHGKTTLSDNLIAGAGMISEELAGKQLVLDYDEQEQARGITINAAAASMVHEYEGEEYLINLIDTPGHVDFGGDVTRAMRAVDGVILVVCAVEGVKPQTETVIRQALKEKVKPVLFINKVDRLINELQLDGAQMQQRFTNIITEVNRLIKRYAPPEFRDRWLVKVENGSVAFGSAYHNWAISVPFMRKSGITFKDVYEHLSKGESKALAKKSPLYKVVLDMVIQHLPSPIEAQRYRIPHIWKGDIESDVGKAMLNVDPKGPLAMMITKIIMDPHAGEVAVGRIFGGTLRRGQEVYIVGMGGKRYRAQQVSMMVGADRIPVEEVTAGNIAAVIGLRDAVAGSTISSLPDMEPFEPIKHYSEPVVTIAIEAKHTRDLPKLIEVLRSVAKADPSLRVEINQETGEHLLSGMGELHLEVTLYRIQHEHGLEVITSEPIVVYRETVDGKGGPFEGKSPNRHNRFYFVVEPLEESVINAIREGEIPETMRIKDRKALAAKLEELGLPRDEAKKVEAIMGPNILLDMTWGIQYLNETMELIKQAFKEVVEAGPLAAERVYGVKVKLVDAKLHEDSIHRGPAQVIPAVRNAIYGAMCQAGRVLLEPMQKIFIYVPHEIVGSVIGEINQRRGVILDMIQEDYETTIIAKAPVAEMFGFASAIRSATGGRVNWSTESAGYERVPRELQHKIVREIRQRKGLNPEPYDESYYAGL
jgi:elongation factor 2